jgi:hypothetical protein
MDLSDVLQLPPGVKVLVALLLWPAIWAGVSLLVAFASDINRHMNRRVAHERVSGHHQYAPRHP